RKQLAGYDSYIARTDDLLAPPAESAAVENAAVDTDTLLGEQVVDHADLQPIYPEQLTDQIDNPEKENPMIAYFAIAIGLIALAVAALPLIRKKEPEQRPTDFDGLEELHRRLDGIALRMK